MADELAASSDAVDGFLETPALALAARDLAQDEPPLPEGTLVGPYRIVALLARGGMGDVYRATDPRLGRDVALKTLPKAEPDDAHAVERFLQEARITASLDHPNIVKVFDVGMSNGRPYLVSELLEGETLRAPIVQRAGRAGRRPRHRRRAGERPGGRARARVGASRSQAGEHLRDQGGHREDPGLWHREARAGSRAATRPRDAHGGDPGHGRLSRTRAGQGRSGRCADGSVRVGIDSLRADDGPACLRARAHDRYAPCDRPRRSARPAAPRHRTDRHRQTPARQGAGCQVSVSRRPAVGPGADRLDRGAGDVAARDAGAADSSARDEAGPWPAQPAWRWSWWHSSVGGSANGQPSQSVAPSLTQFTWSLPAGTGLDSAPIVSPDGRRIAFTAVSGGSTPRLFVRSLDSRDATAIAGTDGAKQPFWSPDGTSLGFFARGKLMKVAVAGGVPVVICDAPDGRGGAWSPSGTIVFSPNLIFEGLARVSADGGPVEPATLVDVDRGENSHRWPVFLPDGVHFLFHVRASIDERRGVYVARIDRPASIPGSPLFRSESEAVFVPTSGRERGVLLSAADGQLQARPFDAAALRLVGDPRTLPVAAGANTPYHSAMLSASADLLATVAMPMPYGVRLGTVARDGTGVRLSARRQQNWPRLSPDGTADGPADDRSGTRQSRHLGRGPPGRQPRPRHHRHRVLTSSRCGLRMGCGWHTDPARLNERRLSIAAADGTGVVQELPCPGSLLRADRLVA